MNRLYYLLNIITIQYKDIVAINCPINMIISHLIKKCNFRSVDEINLFIKKYFPYMQENKKKNISQDYHIIEIIENIKKISDSLISIRNGQVIFKYWKCESDKELYGDFDEKNKVLIFSCLNKLVSMDLFVIVFYLLNDIDDIRQLDGYYQYVNLADAPLDDVLNKGLSENHVHASAAFGFITLWQILMNRRENAKYLTNFKLNAFSNIKDNNELQIYIYKARIIRLTLSLFLKNRESTVEALANTITNDNEIWKCIFQIDYNIELSKLVNYYEKVMEDFFLEPTSSDYINDLFCECKCIETNSESIFLFKAFKFLKDNKDNEIYDAFGVLLLNYIKIKNEFYQQVIQCKQINGLDYFREYFAKATKGIRVSDEGYYYKLMLHSLFNNNYLKQVELRFSFPDNMRKLKGYVLSFLKYYKEVLIENEYINMNDEVRRSYPRLGLIYSFIKREDDIDKCVMMYSKERRDVTKGYLYYEKLKDKYKCQIEKLKELRNNVPYLSDFIVGIDAASLENSTPVRVFAPIYSIARDSTSDKLIFIDGDGNKIRHKSLCFTFHCGEDFRHLISGLRRVDEVIEHCKFHSGDRIGHGTALGLNVEKWAKENNIIIIPKDEQLFNLLWLWGVYSKELTNNADIIVYLENKIFDIVSEVLPDDIKVSIRDLYKWYINSFNDEEIEVEMKSDNSCKRCANFETTKKNNILCTTLSDCPILRGKDTYTYGELKYFLNCKCFLSKAKEPIYVRINDIDLRIMQEVQKFVLEKISIKGIVIEVNPSSNEVIGDMNTVYDNQIYQLDKPDNNYKNISTCIATDDPIVFNTNLSNEMAYIYYGLISKGYGKDRALEWIDKVRENGIKVSFIEQSLSDKEYYRRLCRVIEELEAYACE